MRSNTRDAARRAMLGHVRGTIHASNDQPMMQTVDVRLMHNEMLTGVERMQQYGFTSVPLPPDPNSPKAAEVVVGFVNGTRAHPIVVAVDDRRYRLKGGKNGEVAIHDDQGQVVHLTRDGIVITSGKSVSITAGSDMTLKANTITLDGEVHLGGTGGKPAAMQGTTDTSGNADVGNLATKVYVQ